MEEIIRLKTVQLIAKHEELKHVQNILAIYHRALEAQAKDQKVKILESQLLELSEMIVHYGNILDSAKSNLNTREQSNDNNNNNEELVSEILDGYHDREDKIKEAVKLYGRLIKKKLAPKH